MVDFTDPASRLRHIEAVGPAAYNRDLAEHRRRSTIATINGHAIRPVPSRFGRLYMVGDTGRAFATQAEAEAFAKATRA